MTSHKSFLKNPFVPYPFGRSSPTLSFPSSKVLGSSSSYVPGTVHVAVVSRGSRKRRDRGERTVTTNEELGWSYDPTGPP